MHRQRWQAGARLSGPVVALGLMTLGLWCPSQAVEFTCAGGDVACLITAINTANANGEENTITLEAGAYTLTAVDNNVDGPNGLPSVTSTLVINGAGSECTIIEREASTPGFRIMHIAPAGTLELKGITVTGGDTRRGGPSPNAGRGGGIFNAGRLTLIAVTIHNSVADDGGGGIWNDNRTVTINQSYIVDNTAVSGGGGILSLGGTLTVHNSIISGNADEVAGGGIAIGPGSDGFANTLTITNSRISDNTTGSRGGAIISGSSGFLLGLSKLNISNSTISGNRSAQVGGGISALDTWAISNSTVSRNTADVAAGGVENSGGVGVITNSTISNNSAKRGGGIENVQGPLTLVSSTIADNIAEEGGGLLNVVGTPTLQNTILARNTVGPTGQGPDCSGVITSLGNNLIGDATGCATVLQPTDLTGDPRLGEFTDDGTPGHGHFPLLPGSPAIDAGNDDACPPIDQLGQPHVGRCDIGAIEFQPLDVVTIRQATFVDHLAVIFVAATSSAAPDAELFVTVPDCLTEAPMRRIGNRYIFLRDVHECGTLDGQTATVTSSLGGSASAPLR
jgi:hypothetical protein